MTGWFRIMCPQGQVAKPFYADDRYAQETMLRIARGMIPDSYLEFAEPADELQWSRVTE